MSNRLSHLLAGALLAASILAPAGATASPGRQPSDPGVVLDGPVAARVDSFMTAAAGYGMAGTLLVERDGKVILHKGYGIAAALHEAEGWPSGLRRRS